LACRFHLYTSDLEDIALTAYSGHFGKIDPVGMDIVDNNTHPGKFEKVDMAPLGCNDRRGIFPLADRVVAVHNGRQCNKSNLGNDNNHMVPIQVLEGNPREHNSHL